MCSRLSSLLGAWNVSRETSQAAGRGASQERWLYSPTVEMGEKKWSKVLDMGEQRKLLLLEKSFSIIIYLRNLILLPFTTELTFFKRVKINTSAIQTTGLRRK